MKVLIAGVGNVLRGDDGFGVAVANRLLDEELPAGVTVMEVGIGGIHMVQELLDPFDALIIVDAIDLGREPGTVLVVDPEVPDPNEMGLQERHDALADMHYSTPQRALMLARGLRVLPGSVRLIGCQPKDVERLGEGLSPEVEASISVAVEQVHRELAELAAT